MHQQMGRFVAMQDPYFFGYGSLVNRATHDYAAAHPARVKGWRRVWRHTDLRPIAFLTAEPDSGAEIDGLIASVPGGDWAVLDERETGYDRVGIDTVTHALERPVDVAMYHIPEGKHARPDRDHPLLLSYVDVVFQGYLNEYGEAGLTHFVETTGGWNAPLLDDRDAPRYPRHQPLTRREREIFDDILADLPVKRVRDL